jgi:hypothetical protein
MKIPELRKILAEEGLRPYTVSIDGVDCDGEQYRIDKGGRGWCVYFSERGDRIQPREFLTEDEACDFLLEWLRQDRTAWLPKR